MRILVVDDDPFWKPLFVRWLKEFDVVFVETLSDAITEIKRGKIKIALIDFNLGDVLGDGAAQMIKRIDRSVKIIIHSGDDHGSKFVPKTEDAILAAVNEVANELNDAE